MKVFYLLLLSLGLVFQQTATAQDTVKCKRIVDSVFAKTGEVYFSFTIRSKKEIKKLTKIISIDHLSEDQIKTKQIRAYANRKQFYNFLQLKYKYTILPAPGSLINPTMLDEYEWKNSRGMHGLPAYPTYSAYENLMYKFQTDYPALCKVVNIKTLASGRKLLLLKITDNLNAREDEPQFLYTSTMHGDETTGYPLMLDLIDYLLSNYQTDPRVTHLVNNIEIWINPLANPDGAYAGGNNTISGAKRFNANNIDLNRNYPDPKGGPHPDGEAWQAETNAFMAFADTMNFVMAANFHGGAEVVNFPWDTWSKAAADKNWWVQESKEYADTAQAQSPSKTYLNDLYSGNIPGVTQGYQWYEVEGGRQDYMNYFKHCREVTIELSSTKLLAENQLAAHWNYNRKSLLNYMEECLHGIRGIVTNECTGKPILSKVFITSHDIDSSHVYSDLPVGNYHRPVYAGNYNITFSASGYQSKTINSVAVTKGGTTVLNVQLKPSNAPSKPVITDNNGTLYSSAASGNQWYLSGVIINGATNTSYKPVQNGPHTVITTNPDGCSAESDAFNVIFFGVDELKQKNITVYPNPSEGSFTLSDYGMNLSDACIQVFTMLGKLVSEEKINSTGITHTVNLGSLADGVYYLKLFSKENFYTAKLFLQKK